jgi:hypothetical protein
MRGQGAAEPHGGQEAGSSTTIKPAPDIDGKSAITAIRVEKPKKSTGGVKDTRLLASGSDDKIAASIASNGQNQGLQRSAKGDCQGGCEGGCERDKEGDKGGSTKRGGRREGI